MDCVVIHESQESILRPIFILVLIQHYYKTLVKFYYLPPINILICKDKHWKLIVRQIKRVYKISILKPFSSINNLKGDMKLWNKILCRGLLFPASHSFLVKSVGNIFKTKVLGLPQ